MHVYDKHGLISTPWPGTLIFWYFNWPIIYIFCCCCWCCCCFFKQIKESLQGLQCYYPQI